MQALKNHPFAVEAFFERSLVLTFALAPDALAPLVPPRLSLDVFQERYAFLAVAMVQTRGLRPKGFPALFGADFFLIGYRVFVRYANRAGKRLRGLYILKSETDSPRMTFFGNIFTHYNYDTTDIRIEKNHDSEVLSSQKSGFLCRIQHTNDQVLMPTGSPFSDWKDARRFSGPLPFTFTYDAPKDKMLIIEGVREQWTPKPVAVSEYHFDFLSRPTWRDAVLASAFEVRNVPYYWKKGVQESWQ